MAMQESPGGVSICVFLGAPGTNLDDVGTPGGSHERDLLVVSRLGRAVEVVIRNRLSIQRSSSDSRHRRNRRPVSAVALML